MTEEPDEQFGAELYARLERGRSVESDRFDEHYVYRLAEGDPKTEAHFISYFNRLIRARLRRKVRSYELVEEVCQETFCRVMTTLRRKGGLRNPERLGVFVNTVCNNVLLESFRSEGHTRPFPSPDFDTVDTKVDVASELLMAERKKIVESVVAQLPAKYRDLLRMIFLEEMDKLEVCRRLNLDRKYFRVQLHRAKSYFKRTALIQHRLFFAMHVPPDC